MASNDEHPLSAIAHKLRTPLTVIVSTVNNLLDGAFGKINGDQARWLRKLETHTLSLERLVDQILAVLRADPDRAVVIGRKITGADPEAPVTIQPRPAAPAAPLATILVVDDEPDVVDVIEDALSSSGFQMIKASDGDEAFRLALERKPDLVLMDVLLRHQDGMEICRRIKRALPAFTPVILITGQDHLSTKMTGSGDDADDLLMKPFHIEELFARVRSMLRIKQLTDLVRRREAA